MIVRARVARETAGKRIAALPCRDQLLVATAGTGFSTLAGPCSDFFSTGAMPSFGVALETAGVVDAGVWVFMRMGLSFDGIYPPSMEK